jgi:hypothetical protein
MNLVAAFGSTIKQLLPRQAADLPRGRITHEAAVQVEAAVPFLFADPPQAWHETSEIDLGGVTQNQLHGPRRTRSTRLLARRSNDLGMTHVVAVHQSIHGFAIPPGLRLIGRAAIRSRRRLRGHLHQSIRPSNVAQITLTKLLLSPRCRFHQQV